MNDDVSDRVGRADRWVQDEFAAIASELEELGCSSRPLKRAGIAYRLGRRVVLRVFPRDRHLALGFPNALRDDVDRLTGGLRPQRDQTWLHYGPEVSDRATVLTLVARSADLRPALHPETPAEPGLARVTQADHGVHDDAALTMILQLLQAFRRFEERIGRATSVKVIREALWFHWEAPGLPPGGKYSAALPHTAAARARKIEGHPKGFVLEHLVPVSILIRQLLADLPEDTEALRARLSVTRHVVITREEDLQLAAAGVSSSVPDPADPWSRYRAAGIDPSTIAPLEAGAS